MMNRRDALKGIVACAAGIVLAPTEAITFPSEPSQSNAASFSIGVDCSKGLSDAAAVFIMWERRVIEGVMLPAQMLEEGIGYIPTIMLDRHGWPVSGSGKSVEIFYAALCSYVENSTHSSTQRYTLSTGILF